MVQINKKQKNKKLFGLKYRILDLFFSCFDNESEILIENDDKKIDMLFKNDKKIDREQKNNNINKEIRYNDINNKVENDNEIDIIEKAWLKNSEILEQRKILTKTVKGIKNKKNTCFLNSVLQILITSNIFKEYLSKLANKESEITNSLIQFIESYKNSEKIFIPSKEILDLFIEKKIIDRKFESDGFDVNEFTENLLMKLNEEIEIQKIISNELNNFIICDNCKQKKYINNERFYNLNLKSNSIKIMKNYNGSIQEGIKNEYNSNKINDYSDVEEFKCKHDKKSIQIINSLGDILIINIESKLGFNFKIEIDIEIIKKYRILGYVFFNKFAKHYVALVRFGNKFYFCNDKTIKDMGSVKVLLKDYCLRTVFYELNE